MRLLTLLVAALLVSACDYYSPKDSQEGSTSGSRRGDTASAASPAPQDPLKPVFSSIQEKVLNVRCIVCHSPGGEAQNVPFGTLNDLLDSPRDLVLPGDPDESGLMIAITRPDEKRMPPPRTGGPLSDEEIAVIRQWIQEGAKP